MLEKLTKKEEVRKKECFYASDYGKPSIDLYLSLLKTPKTNKLDWRVFIRLGAGKGAEVEILQVLKDSGLVNEDYDQEKDGRVEFKVGDVEVHGYIDAILKDGTPVEIKTINNKNSFDIANYANGSPRMTYCGQLAVYMDFLKKDKGILFAASIDGINVFWIEMNKIKERVYQCGDVIINLNEEYQRWADILEDVRNHDGVIPEEYVNEFIYKFPIEEVEWNKLPSSKISKARANKAVVGDWQVQYSPYKDLIIQLQGSELGYSDKEIEYIKNVTKGYSKRK